MPVRLVATDLDGTLFGAGHVPSQRTVDAVNAVADAGIVTVAATGRSHFDTVDLLAGHGLRFDWFVGSNGSSLVNAQSGELVDRLVFDTHDLAALVAQLASVLDEVGFGYEHDDGFSWTPAFIAARPTHTLSDSPRRDTSERRDAATVGKLFVTAGDLGTTEVLAQITPSLPAGINATQSGVGAAELTPHGADKGSALARLCARLGIARGEVIAFGDNLNDITMLRWAGRGVAVANAVAVARAVASETTLANDENGVAEVLESLV